MELTEQQKLEILCAYLPHGVEVENAYGNKIKLKASHFFNDYGDFISINNAKLILRHSDDMTESELSQLGRIIWGDDTLKKEFARNDARDWLKGTMKPVMSPKTAQSTLRYLHSIHVDTFGAIEAGWAIRKENN